MYRNRLRFKLEKSSNDEAFDDLEVVIENFEESGAASKEEKELNQTPVHVATPVQSLSLNDIIISRGANSFLSNLDLYINDYLITTVQGDGLIISTPTGSTAYAMAAGASMCHPSVAAMVIAPICPHSLSFRPIVVPAGVELKICLNVDARNTEAS